MAEVGNSLDISRVLRGSHTMCLYHLNIYRDSLPKLPRPAPVLHQKILSGMGGFKPHRGQILIDLWGLPNFLKGLNTKRDLVYRQYCLLPAPKHIKKKLLFPNSWYSHVLTVIRVVGYWSLLTENGYASVFVSNNRSRSSDCKRLQATRPP